MPQAKTHISLGICLVWSESLPCTQWVVKDPSFLHVDSKDSDQTGRMPRLIWVFAGRTCHFVGFVMRRFIFVLNSVSGYIPRIPFKFGGTYKNDCDVCIDEHMTNYQNQEFKMRDLKQQVSLGICLVWSESLPCTQWVVKDPSFLHVDSKDSDQTGRMPRLWSESSLGTHLFCWFCHVVAQIRLDSCSEAWLSLCIHCISNISFYTVYFCSEQQSLITLGGCAGWFFAFAVHVA